MGHLFGDTNPSSIDVAPVKATCRQEKHVESSTPFICLQSVCCNTDIRGVVVVQEKGSVAGLVFANWRIADIL